MGQQLRAQWKVAGLPLPEASGNFPGPKGNVTGPQAGPQPLAVALPNLAPAKIGRHDPCPCGSGMKYKKCCGR